jgi:hypothetical protein
MNAFWKGLVASVAVYQLILTYRMLDLADYFVWRFHGGVDTAGLLDTLPGRKSAVIVGGALIALVVFNLWMLYRSTRSASDG